MRRKMAYAGLVSVSMVVNSKGRIVSGPEPRISGFPEGKNGAVMDELLDAVADEAEDIFDSLPPKAKRDEDAIEAKLKSRLRRKVKELTGKRCVVEAVVHKVKG